jgi:signal transduction histidine kinase
LSRVTIPPTEDTSFARLVSLGLHDLRTPLATLHGFTRMLARVDELGEPASTYVGMMEAASTQLADLLDDLGIVTRIEARRYDPGLQEADTLAIARGAAELVGEQAAVSGPGGRVRVDPDAATRAVRGLARCALRHGGLQEVRLVADGTTVEIAPVVAQAAPIVMGEELRDLGAAIAHRIVAALGGSVALDGDVLAVRFAT